MPERTEPQVVTLHALRRPTATLRDALAAARELIPHAHLLLYSPAALLLRRIEEVDLDDLAGLDAPYEARFFGPEAEIRWVEGEGRRAGAVLLAETHRDFEGWEPAEPARRALALDRTYLVTPQAVEGVKDLGRGIPPFDPDKERLALSAREYLAEIDVHGNVGLLAERLVGFIACKIDNNLPSALEIPPDWKPAPR